MSNRSAFENETLAKHGITPYKSPYKLYKHKGNTNSKVTPKKTVTAQPKTGTVDMIADTLKDMNSRKKKLSVFTPLSK